MYKSDSLPKRNQEKWGVGVQDGGSQSVAKKLQAVEAQVHDLKHELQVVKHELYTLKHTVKLGASTPHHCERYVVPTGLEIANRADYFGPSTSRKDYLSNNIPDDTNHQSGIRPSHSLGSVSYQATDPYLAGACPEITWEGKAHLVSAGVSESKQPAQIQDPWEGIFDFDAASIEGNTAGKSGSLTGLDNVGVDYHAARFKVHGKEGHAPPLYGDFEIDAVNMRPQGGYTLQPSEPAMASGVNLFQAASLASGPSALQDNSDLDRALGIISGDMNSFNDEVMTANSYASNIAGPTIAGPQVQRRHLNRVRGTIPCPQCSKTFGRTSDLDRHSRVHDANAVRYSCPATGCGKAYLRSDLLRRHRAKTGH